MRKSKKVKLQEQIEILNENQQSLMKEICETKQMNKKLKDYIVFKNNIKKGEKYIITRETKRIDKPIWNLHTFVDFPMMMGNAKFIHNVYISYLKNEEVIKLCVCEHTSNYKIVNDYLEFYNDQNVLVNVYKINQENNTINESDLELYIVAKKNQTK